MATTQKKARGGAASSGRRTSTSSGRHKKKPTTPIRREVGAALCLFLAIFSAFGYVHIEAIFIDFFCGALKGLLGYGFWLMPPMLLVASILLTFHRSRPVKARVWCALLLPLLLGCFLHLLLARGTYEWGFSMVGPLWRDGQALQSGGVISGLLALSFTAVFSKLGAEIAFVLGMVVLIMAAFRVSLVDLVDAIRNRPHLEYEEQEAPKRQPKPSKVPPATATQPRSKRKANIDIPVDEPNDAPPPSGAGDPVVDVCKQVPFFNRRAAVPSPDQVLTGPTDNRPTAETEAVFPDRVPQMTEPVPPEIVREPAIPKVKAAEAAQVAAELAQDIEKKMTEDPPLYQYPPVSLLKEGSGSIGADAIGELKSNQIRLSDTIRSFGIEANIANVTRGPSVTRYELELDQGVRLNKLTNLADDIALALGATGVRIAPIPDKISMVGIEVPNKLVSPVYIHDVIDSTEFRAHSSKVCFSVGKDIGGNCIVGNIAKLPHLLIAGTTGSGKSVCTNSLIISLLYKATPEEVRLIMVDPKMVELGIYNGIPHLLIPVVTDPKKAAGALQWAVTEMMKRYRSFSEVGVRDLASYNTHAAKTDERSKLPQVVVVIDELADLMLVAAKEVEESICRVAQMGRAAGMHLIIATQRPSADVITGLMKANIPSRIAFAVASSLESRIILDTTGAEKLVGRGDMLYFPLGTGKPQRVQGCLISDEEVANVVEFVKRSGGAEYDESIIHEIEQNAAEKEKGAKGVGGSAPEAVDNDYDELLSTAIEVVVDTGMASVSMLQRRLKLGYARAARLVDQMEEKGVVGPFEGSKPRQLLITKEQWQEMQFRQGMVAPQSDQEAVPDELAYEGDAIGQGGETPPFDLDE